MTIKNLGRMLIAVTVAGSLAGSAYGQSSTQGAVAGTVLDTTSAAVPNASVTIRNVATDQEFHLTSDGSGFYKAPLLEPGTYLVKVTASGFTQYKADHVIVQVGQLTTLSPHLSVEGSAQTVDVTAETPVLNFDSPDFTSNINQRDIDNIPINNRRWSSLALLTPGVVVDSSGYGLISVRGISTILNNIEIDGADDNQAYFSEERGRTREAYSTSASAVREFAVNTGVYAAEYGRAAGGVVNSVTKSGTNDIHGEAYFYDRESKWNAYNDFSTIPQIQANGSVLQVPFKPEDVRKIYGFTVGGPIMKDKLFFMYTYDQHSRIFPLSAVASNPASTGTGFNALPDATLPAGATCNTTTGYLTVATGTTVAALDGQTCTLAARLGQTYAQGYSTYNAGINGGVNGAGQTVLGLNQDLGLIPRAGYQEINTPKLDWQASSKEHVSFLFHRLRWDSPGGVQTNATGNYSLDATGTDFVKLDYGLAKLTSLVTGTISNEILYQYGRELNDEGQTPYSAYTLQNLVNPSTGNVPYISLDSGTGFNVGSPYYSYRPKYPDERKWQIEDTLYYSKGNHSLKFGVDMVHNYDLTNQAQYYEGLFTYSNNIANYLADLYSKGLGHGVCDAAQQTAASATATAVGTYPCYTSYQQNYGPTTFDFSTLDYAVFAQDNWKFNRKLTLELGVRYDYERQPNAVTSLTTATGSFLPFNGLNNNPSDGNNIGPRIGFAYDPFGTGNTVIRGGVGMYYGRVTNGNIGTVISTTGSPLAQTSVTYTNNAANRSIDPLFPNQIPAALLNSTAKPSAYFRASNLQNPQVDEYDLNVQQGIGKGTFVQVSYLGGLGRELPNFLNVNLNPATEAPTTITVLPAAGTTNCGPLGCGPLAPVNTFTSYGNTALLGPNAGNFQAITEYLSNINSSYNALVFEVQNRQLKSIQFDANYTWSHALDFYQNSSTAGSTNNWYDPYANPRANYGNSSFNIPNRLVLYAIYNFPGVSAGKSYLKYLTNDWSLDDTFSGQTGLNYSENATGTSSSQSVLGDLNANGSISYIPQLGHNNLTYRRDLVDDVRVQKNIPFTERYRLQLILQAFNVANHQNVTSVNTPAYKLAKTANTTNAGTATYQANFGTVSNTNNSGFSYTPRQLELSIRFAF